MCPSMGRGGARSKLTRYLYLGVQEFPVSGFNLEDRVLSRTVAKKLAADGVDTGALGLEPFDEPLLYDLCTSSSASRLLRLSPGD